MISGRIVTTRSQVSVMRGVALLLLCIAVLVLRYGSKHFGEADESRDEA